MPQFPWQKSSSRSTRPGHASPYHYYFDSEHPGEQDPGAVKARQGEAAFQRPLDHRCIPSHPAAPELLTAPPADLPLPSSLRPPPSIQRSTSVVERHVPAHIQNRRSVAVFPSQGSGQPVQDYSPTYYPAAATNTAAGQTPFEDLSYFHPPPAPAPATAPASSGPSRSHTVALRDHRGRGSKTTSPALDRADTPSSLWSPGFQPLPSPSEQEEIYSPDAASMHSNTTPGKTSSESGSATGLDRWSQRRLQRLNTEQGFREQRQGGGVGGGGVLSPPPSDHVFAQPPEAQPQPLHQQSQPPTFYPASRSGSNAGLGLQTQLNSNNNNTHSRPSLNYQHDAAQQQQQQQTHQTQQQQQPQYSPPDTSSQFSSPGSGRPNLQQTRSFSQQAAAAAEADSMSASNSSSINNNGSIAAPKAVRSAAANRQSLHNDMLSRDTSNMSQQGVPSFSASVVPSASQAQPYKSDQTSQTQSDPRRPTPQPLPTGEDMSEEGVTQLIKDHKELREKYTKVKKYYFEKEDQVKQLQNSLAHQRLSQSRTSLDDSEYTTRFNRLDGLIAQLAFSIRKSWRSLPSWLANSVNKDAVATGKQEMTAAGRSFISCWLVEEVFDKYFHPDLDVTLSAQLKSVQRNIRRYAPFAVSTEEEESLTSKVVNWRLCTLEGLQDALRSPQCPTNRSQLTDMLKEHLCGALSVHLQDPPPSDLEGGVHMIIELVVSIAIHLPLESRDVVIEYFAPGHNVAPDHMKVESGIPPLSVSIAEDSNDRASMKSATSEITDMNDPSGHDGSGQPGKKRSMLSALTGTGGKSGKSSASQGRSTGASGSSSSLHRPDSSSGIKEEAPPKVRMAAGIGVSIRGRTILVKAPVFST